MIGHRTAGQDLNPLALTVFLQPLQIRPSVFIAEKHVLAVIPSLGNVMRNTGKYRSG